MDVRRYFRTPKGLTIIALVVILIPAMLGEGALLVLPELSAAIAAAMLVDAVALRIREGEWVFPDGALLTGLIVGMILSPHEPWHVSAIASAAGVLSKYAFRVRRANVFNPAALALLLSYFVFQTGHSWWGALPDVTPFALVFLFATGIFIANRVGKMPLVLAFLGIYYTLFTIAAFVGDAGQVAELYRAPDLHMALFFAFFMATDPPTSPPKPRDQLTYGVIAAVTSFATFELTGGVYFLLVGLLVANLWEAVRKLRMPRHRGTGPAAGREPRPAVY